MTVKILEISLLKQTSFLVRWNILYALNFVEKGNMTVKILKISLLKQTSFFVRWSILYALRFVEQGTMALNKTENISVKTEVFSRELDYHSHLFIGIALTLSICFGLIMNVMIIYVFIRKSKLRTQTNWLVFAIVSTDFIMICFGIPMAAVSSFYNRWVFGTWGCTYYAFLMSFTGFVEITLLTLISICRYIVIVKSNVKHLITQKVVLTLICGSTLYSLTWAVLPLIGWSSYDVEAAYTTCSVNWRRKDLNHISFSFSAMTFNLFIPFTIILYCYIGIFRKVSNMWYYLTLCMFSFEIKGPSWSWS